MTILRLLFLMLLTCSCQNMFEDRFVRPQPEPYAFTAEVGMGIRITFLQEQDPDSPTLAVNSRFKITAEQQEFQDVTMLVAIRKSKDEDFKTLVRKEITGLSLEKDSSITYPLANKLEELFDESDVWVSLVHSGPGGVDYSFAGTYSGHAITFRSRVVQSASLTDVVIDYRGTFDLELVTPAEQVRFLHGLHITPDRFTGTVYSNANSNLGGFTGSIYPITGAADSLRIAIALANTTYADTITFHLKRNLP